MSDKHSNANIQKEIDASQDLQKKVEKKLSDGQDYLRQVFQQQFGIPVPSALDALVLQADSSLQYASQSVVSEYTEGLSAVIGPVLDGKYPEAALAATTLVGTVLDNIVGSSSIKGMENFKSSRTVDNGTAIISAIMVTSFDFSKKDWKISQDFSACSYMFIVFKDPNATLVQR